MLLLPIRALLIITQYLLLQFIPGFSVALHFPVTKPCQIVHLRRGGGDDLDVLKLGISDDLAEDVSLQTDDWPGENEDSLLDADISGLEGGKLSSRQNS